MTVLKGDTIRQFFQEHENVQVRVETKGNGVDVAALEIWRVPANAIVTVAGSRREIDPPKERIECIMLEEIEWFFLKQGKYEAVLPRIVIPSDSVVLAFPRSTFNRLHGFYMLPTALWDSGFAARGTLSFEVRVKELRFPRDEPLFQLVALRAETVTEEQLYGGHWQEKRS